MKREAFVVSGSSAAVGGSSLIFYSILMAQSDATLMAGFISITAIASIVQIGLVPNTMIFVYSAGTRKRRNNNVFYAVILEIIGLSIGALLLGLAALVYETQIAIIIVFLSYSMAGSTSCIGYIRAENRWLFYIIAFVLPSALRLAIILIDLANGRIQSTLSGIALHYLLLPEIIRYAIVVPPIFFSNFRMPNWLSMQRACRIVFGNWVYDVGSAMVEVGDRLILSLLLSPNLLVLYFFARRLGAATTIVLEPFYAITFKTIVNSKVESYLARDLLNVLGRGYIISGTIALLCWGSLSSVLYSVQSAASFIPALVEDFGLTFGALVLIDAAIAANRWGRYLSLLDGHVLALMTSRLMCLALFFCIVWLWPSETRVLGLLAGFASFAVLEFSFICLRSRNLGVSRA